MIAWHQAITACVDFLNQHRKASMEIVFAILSDDIIKVGQQMLLEYGSAYKIAERYDWKSTEMPSKHDTFVLHRPLNPKQMKALRRGNIPKQMEDKWFWFMEGDTLFAHRSWTGYCIYRIDFKPDGNHIVTVNRDPEQYTSTSVSEDAESLNKLLNWWTHDTYDYYGEWLEETVDDLEKAGKITDGVE